MRISILILLHLFIAFKGYAQEKPIAIVGATMIDVTNYGDNEHDISHSIVILQYGKIIAAGKRKDIIIPSSATVIHADGKYIVPGLIDCFSVIGTQGQANAHLYYGVTTIVAGPGNFQREGVFPGS